MEELYEYVINFMRWNGITCQEDIAQSDSIQDNLGEFLGNCFDFVKKDLD